MISHPYPDSRAPDSLYPSYQPGAPSSSYNRPNQPRYSTERPPSQASSSRSPYGQPPRSPLHLAIQHAKAESDEYDERVLGEIAAANQAAQEQRWGPHAALSEAPARYELYHDQQHAMDRHTSMPVMPGSFEPLHYDGGFYMEPHLAGSYDPVPQYYEAQSIASSHTLGGRSRQSLPVQASPLMYPPPSTSASEPPHMFNVHAAHHLPGARTRPLDAPAPGVRIGDSLPGFPSWSHTWYGGHLSADGHAYTMVPPGSGQSGWESETLSHGRHGPAGPHSLYAPYPYGRVLTHDQVKEERIRMLEKEFGPKVSRNGKGKAMDDESADDHDAEPEETPIGGIDANGRLVLPRRKVRIATRWLQCLVSLGAAGLGIGGFILVRPEHKAPPSGTFASFVLYGVSALSTIVCLWLFRLEAMLSIRTRICWASRHGQCRSSKRYGDSHHVRRRRCWWQQSSNVWQEKANATRALCQPHC